MTTPDPRPSPRHSAEPDSPVEIAAAALPPGYGESLIRTWVPVGIGSALAWAALHWHVVVDAGLSSTVSAVVTALCIAGYYALSRLVERRWPRVGAFLISFGLVQSKPIYAQPTEAARLIDTRTLAVRSVEPVERSAPYPYPPTTDAGAP